MTTPSSQLVPPTWHGIFWALSQPRTPARARLVLALRALWSCLVHGEALRRWMGMVHEARLRGLTQDGPAQYLRALRPHIHSATTVSERVSQLVDQADWLETAFMPHALQQLLRGQPLLLADLPAPRGYEFLRLHLQQAPANTLEGELLLTLTLRRASHVQPHAPAVDVAVLGFSRLRLRGESCLAIGGVRGQRDPVLRLSTVELSQALHGWSAPVLMVRVAQQLARYWNLRLVGLAPSAHRLHAWPYRLNPRFRRAVQRIDESYNALWDHFEATPGPPGWMVLPVHSDDQLAATALSPEKRARQTRRADYWIRVRHMLDSRLSELLLHPERTIRLGTATHPVLPDEGDEAAALNDGADHVDEDRVFSRAYDTGPGSLL